MLLWAGPGQCPLVLYYNLNEDQSVNTTRQMQHSNSITENTAEQIQQSKCNTVSASQPIKYYNLCSIKV